MAEVITPELTLTLFRTLQILLRQYPESIARQDVASLKLRTIIFDLYNELIFLMRFHQVDYNHVEYALASQYELTIFAVHRLNRTDQFGSVFNVPQ